MKTKFSKYSKNRLLKIIIAQKERLAKLQSENYALTKKASLLADGNAEIDSLKEMIALMPGNIFWKDRTGKYLGCNNNVAKWLGFQSPDDIVGKYNNDFLPTEYSKKLEQADQEIMASKKGKFIEEAGIDLNNNNQQKIFFSHKIPLFNRSHEVIGLLGISLDITEQKKMEEELKIAKDKAEASNRAKSQFLAVINHELRTPLTCIIGLTDILKQHKLPPNERYRTIAAIESCSQYLLNLVKDVLDFSRLETGKYNINMTAVSIASTLHEIRYLLKPLAEKKGLNLEIEIDPALPKFVLTEQRLLRHILINLINNAIKFTEKGYVKIQINLLEKTLPQVKIEIKVMDTGIGMPSDKLDIIFKPFQQLEDAYTRQSSRSGTGLGLSIVKKLAELIHIRIKVSSKLGKGSTFSLIGDFETRENPAQVMQLPKKFPVRKNNFKKLTVTEPTKQPKILLIEDDPIIQFIHEKMLSELGCKVDTATCGREALEKVNQHHMILVDISLPDTNGFEIIKEMRRRHDTRQIPMIALTVFTGKEEKIACLKAGADEFASKPISRARLKRLLQKYIHLASFNQF